MLVQLAHTVGDRGTPVTTRVQHRRDTQLACGVDLRHRLFERHETQLGEGHPHRHESAVAGKLPSDPLRVRDPSGVVSEPDVGRRDRVVPVGEDRTAARFAELAPIPRFVRRFLEKHPTRALYGTDLAVNALYATLQRGKPHEQAAAIGALGEARDKAAIAAIMPMLWHDYPLVRYYAQRALQHITGDAVAIDVGGAAADVKRAAEAWFTTVVARR